MSKNDKSVVVFQIQLKLWWMIPVGVKSNHTKYEADRQRWRPGVVGPSLKNYNLV